MPVSNKKRPKITYDKQLRYSRSKEERPCVGEFKHVTWTVKDGKIEKDEYVRVNHNGKIRNKHMHRVFNPRSMKNKKGMDGKCNSLFPGRHTRRNLPNTKMIADVPELMGKLSMNVRTPKMVTFNPHIKEFAYEPTQHRIPNNPPVLFPVSTKIDRMPVSNDIVFLDGLSLKVTPKKKRVKRRSHKNPTSLKT